MWKAHLASKQLGHDCDPQGQHKEDVGNAHAKVVGQLVGLPADLVHVEANGENDGRQAEEDHGQEAEPASELDDPALPVGERQEKDGDVDAENAQHDADERQQPLPAHGVRNEADGRTTVDSEAGLKQADVGVSANL